MEGPQEGFPTVERPSLDTHETNPPLPPSFSYQTEPTVCHMFGIGFGHIVLWNMLSCKKSRAYKYEWMILLLSTAFPNLAKKHKQHLPLSIKISVEQEAKHCPTRHFPEALFPPLWSLRLSPRNRTTLAERWRTHEWISKMSWSTRISHNTWHITHSVGEEKSFVILQIVHQAWTLWQENSQPSQLRKTRLYTWVTAFTIRNKLTQPVGGLFAGFCKSQYMAMIYSRLIRDYWWRCRRLHQVVYLWWSAVRTTNSPNSRPLSKLGEMGGKQK